MPIALSVNRARVPVEQSALGSGIDKIPVEDAVRVRAPGSRRSGQGSGLVGDSIGNRRHHGGDDQAVYAYAREDLDAWQTRLGRPLANGMFGENLTTSGLDVTNAVIGERWAIGTDGVVLEVSRPRTPCRTFTTWLGIAGWAKTFTNAALPGAYLRVITPGAIRAGDRIDVVARPDHQVTIGTVFRALTLEPQLLPELSDVPALAEEIKRRARRRVSP